MSGGASNRGSVLDRLWDWLARTIPTGAGWMLDGRWMWQRRFGAWWLAWWGKFFYYQKSWFRGPE